MLPSKPCCFPRTAAAFLPRPLPELRARWWTSGGRHDAALCRVPFPLPQVGRAGARILPSDSNSATSRRAVPSGKRPSVSIFSSPSLVVEQPDCYLCSAVNGTQCRVFARNIRLPSTAPPAVVARRPHARRLHSLHPCLACRSPSPANIAFTPHPVAASTSFV